MHVLESEDDLSSVEFGSFLIESFCLLSVQVVEKFASVDQLHNHVDVEQVLEGVL